MKTITLRISNHGPAWNDAGPLSWTATNLGKADFRFRDREPIFWEAEMTGYRAVTGELQIRVVDYHAQEASFRPALRPKQPVLRLRFAPLDGEKWKSQLSYYKSGDLEPLLAGQSLAAVSRSTDTAPAAAPEKTGSNGQESVGTTVRFTIPLLELSFGNGGVKGHADLPGLVETVSFGIPNDQLVAEFDAIKPFFVRALGRKTIRVTATLHFVNDEPRLTNAASPDLARIDDSLIEVFRARSVRQLLSPDHRQAVDKSLFTPEDVFASLDDDALGKATLPTDGHDLLAEILRQKNVRNARQLEFLAGKLHPPGRKLRFVLSPEFGFVFLAKGQDGHHFILELLDSHATYVWSIPQDWETLAEQYRAVEREIMAIGRLGRGQYRRTLHFEYDFWFVVHENAESDLVDGFPRWKNRLLEGLV